jgi:hypothetical protein
MSLNASNLPQRLYRIGALLLALGLCAAALIYLMSAEDAGPAVGYVVADGNTYSIAPRDSKKFRHDLELYGGKAALLADEFSNWFAGFWQGRTLAFTVAGISIAIAGLLFYFAGLAASEPHRRDPGERNDDGAGR